MKRIVIGLCLPLIFLVGCQKFLDEKSDKSLVIPSTISDAQALLDDGNTVTLTFLSDATICDDNYWVTDKYLNTRDINTQHEYVWTSDAAIQEPNWRGGYRAILSTNVALETLDKITPDNASIQAYNLARGMALVYRAMHHHALVINMCLQYQNVTAANTLGIPYKKTSEINDPTVRPSLASNYADIIADLKVGIAILPLTVNYPTRPTKAAAYGALARIYLSMADYGNALLYADSCLQLKNSLLNFNQLNATSTVPFNRYNTEDIFHLMASSWGILRYPNWNCDSSLYNSYSISDLRKVYYFRKNSNGVNTYSFKGTYDQDINLTSYTGIAVDEMYITRAECYARAGNNDKALADLNTLLSTRYVSGTYIPYTTANVSDVLGLILNERRKELVGRGNLRWMDLKRLNLEPNYAKTLTRISGGTTYTLPPNDKRYALLLPPSVVEATGISQNQR